MKAIKELTGSELTLLQSAFAILNTHNYKTITVNASYIIREILDITDSEMKTLTADTVIDSTDVLNEIQRRVQVTINDEKDEVRKQESLEKYLPKNGL